MRTTSRSQFGSQGLGPSHVFNEFWKQSSGYRARRHETAGFCAHPSVEGSGVRVGLDHKLVGAHTCCFADGPNKESPAGTTSECGRLDEELEQVGFLSNHLDLCDANDFPAPFRNDNRG